MQSACAQVYTVYNDLKLTACVPYLKIQFLECRMKLYYCHCQLLCVT